MMEWFSTIFGPETEPMMKVYWGIALFASVVFVIQMIMTFVGFDADATADTDFDADGFHIFTIKGLISFLLGFGWTGVLLSPSISNPVLLGAAAVGVGVVFLFLILFIMRQVMKLSVNNSFKLEQSVGLVGSVYLRIPSARKSCGKVQLSVNGTIHELEALTDGHELPTGSRAKVMSVIDDHTVLVEQA